MERVHDYLCGVCYKNPQAPVTGEMGGGNRKDVEITDSCNLPSLGDEGMDITDQQEMKGQ